MQYPGTSFFSMWYITSRSRIILLLFAHIVQKKIIYIKLFLLSRFYLSMVVLKCPAVTQCQSKSCLQQSHATPSLNLSPGIPDSCSFYVEYREINLIFTWDWCALLTRPELINYTVCRTSKSVSNLNLALNMIIFQKNPEIIGDRVFHYVNYYTTITLMIFRAFFIRIENFPAENNSYMKIIDFCRTAS